MKNLTKLVMLLCFIVTYTSCEDETIFAENEQNQAFNQENEDALDEENCETAFAYQEDGCFLEDGFSRWGWSIGPFKKSFKDTFDIYQAAGQCNTENGELVGSFSVAYSTSKNTVLVEYRLFDGYELSETHFYVGNEKYPIKNGQYTVAPGQYTDSHEYLYGSNYDSFLIENVKGTIYFIAHAVVCEEDDEEILPTDSL
jgi:hypothetical protein